MINEELRRYITSQIDSGIPQEEIKSNLIAVGWGKEQIAVLINNYNLSKLHTQESYIPYKILLGVTLTFWSATIICTAIPVFLTVLQASDKSIGNPEWLKASFALSLLGIIPLGTLSLIITLIFFMYRWRVQAIETNDSGLSLFPGGKRVPLTIVFIISLLLLVLIYLVVAYLPKIFPAFGPGY